MGYLGVSVAPRGISISLGSIKTYHRFSALLTTLYICMRHTCILSCLRISVESMFVNNALSILLIVTSAKYHFIYDETVSSTTVHYLKTAKVCFNKIVLAHTFWQLNVNYNCSLPQIMNTIP